METRLSRIAAILSLPALLCIPARPQDPASAPPFSQCTFGEGVPVVVTAPLGFGTVPRIVETVNGPYTVYATDGWLVNFADMQQDFYASVRVEYLSPGNYNASKDAVISGFEHTLSSSNSARNDALNPRLNGFNIFGVDWASPASSMLGTYIFFDDVNQAVTTIYFLNPLKPKHTKTPQEYAALRDHFLNEYTACRREALE